MTTTNAIVKHCYGTAAAWTSANPTLLAGEVGIESDTGADKVGDGTTAWNSLSYRTIGTAGLADSTTAAWDTATPGEIQVHVIRPDQINVAFDTNSTALTAPLYMVVKTAWAGTITATTIISVDENGAALSGSASVEVWKKAGGIPTVSDKISASDPIVLSSASYTRKTSFTGWTLDFAAGDVFIFKLSSVTTCKRVQIAVEAVPVSA